MIEIRYRIELWDGDTWRRAGYEYALEEKAMSELHELYRSDKETVFRLVKCTYEVIALRAFLTEIPAEGEGDA